MSVLEILQYPDPRLRIKAQPVTKFDDELKRIVADMSETMYQAEGLGLAATQVNIHQRVFVMDMSKERNQSICVINPEIVSQEGEQIDYHGCLSVGAGLGISDQVKRAAKLRFRGYDLQGKMFEMDAEGDTAICVQHEIDHLNGILFIDHLSRMKIERIRKKIEKFNNRK